jgi:hypothetical protein
MNVNIRLIMHFMPRSLNTINIDTLVWAIIVFPLSALVSHLDDTGPWQDVLGATESRAHFPALSGSNAQISQ